MPLDATVGCRCCNHFLNPPLPEMVKHLLIQSDLLQPVLACFAGRSVPAEPRRALIPTRLFITLYVLPDQPTICHTVSRISRPAHIISPHYHTMYRSQNTVTALESDSATVLMVSAG